jgi:drug/metabolite transporter (DMT)-like permease
VRVPAELLLLLCVVIWSGNFTVTKISLDEFSPLAFFLVRFLLGAAVTLAFAVARHGMPRFRRQDLGLLVLGAVLGVSVNQFAFVNALNETTAISTALLVGTTPIWAAGFASIVGQERVSRWRWLLIMIGLGGVALIVVGGRAGPAGGSLLGDGLALTVAVSWGAYTVIVRPLMARYSAVQVSSFMMVVGTVVMLPIALPAGIAQDWSRISIGGWSGLLYASLLSVTLTNILLFKAVHQLGATRAALFEYLEPFLAVVIAMIVLGEQPLVVQVVGGLIVLAAVAADRHPAEAVDATAPVVEVVTAPGLPPKQ